MADGGSMAIRRKALGLAMALSGLGVCAALIARTGPRLLFVTLGRGAYWVILIIGLEGVRFLAELWSTRAVLGGHAARVPFLMLLRSQLLCFAFCTLMPAGRTVGEAAKAATLSSVLPRSIAGATGAAGQIMTLLINGCVGLVGGALALRVHHGAGFASACFVYGGTLMLLGSTLALAIRSKRAARVLAGFRPTARWSSELLGAAHHSRGVGLRALFPQLLARGLQGLQLALFALALGHVRPWGDAPLLQAIYTLGAAAGELIPAQVGLVDAAFALGEPLLGMSQTSLVALGLGLHLAQLTGALACLLGAVALGHSSARSVELGCPPREPAWET